MQDEYLERENLEKEAEEAKEVAAKKDEELKKTREQMELMAECAWRAQELTWNRNKEVKIKHLQDEVFSLRQTNTERAKRIRDLEKEKAQLERELQEARAREPAQAIPAGSAPCCAFTYLMSLSLNELEKFYWYFAIETI